MISPIRMRLCIWISFNSLLTRLVLAKAIKINCFRRIFHVCGCLMRESTEEVFRKSNLLFSNFIRHCLVSGAKVYWSVQMMAEEFFERRFGFLSCDIRRYSLITQFLTGRKGSKGVHPSLSGSPQSEVLKNTKNRDSCLPVEDIGRV